MEILLNSNITTATNSSVVEVMEPFANSAIDLNAKSKENQKALKEYKKAIDKIYRSINAKDEDSIILNSSPNEATTQLYLSMYLKYILTGRKNSVILSQRASIDELKIARFLESQGCRVHRVPVTVDGTVDIDILREYITSKTALVSVPLVDEESGVIQPIEEIATMCAFADVPLYVNAKDAIGRVPIDVQRDEVAFMSFASDNIGGPKDIAALYISSKAPEILPTVFGGDSEQGGLRAMPKDISKVIGFAKALEEAVDALDFDIEDIKEIRDDFEQELLEIDGIYSLASWALRVPTVTIVAVKGVHASMLIDTLANKGVVAYSFATYVNRNFQRVSLVDIASLDSSLRHSVIGFSFSSKIGEEEAKEALKIIKESIEELRAISADCKGAKDE
jgi:cysteine desulfurase